MVQLIPKLVKTKMVACSDDEFTLLLDKWFGKSGLVTKCENHVCQNIGRAVASRGGTKKDQNFYKNEYK